MYKLIIEDDEGKTTVVPLIRDEITIGRKEGNTIRLTERNVSRRHAKLTKGNGSIYIEDLQSYNGIKVNGDRIAGRAPVAEGDRIQIGDYQLALKMDKTQAAAPQAERGDEKTVPFIKEERTSVGPAAAAPEAERPAKLVVVSSNFARQEFVLDKAQVVIGRTDDNDIVVNHRSISRHHAKIERQGGHYHVIDLQSANGVRVNGEEYGKVELRRGDHIDLGHVRLRFVAPGEDFVFDRDAKVVDVGGTEKKKGGSLIAIIAVAAILLIGGGIAAMKLIGGDKPGGGGDKPSGDTEVQLLKLNADVDVAMKALDWETAIEKAEKGLGIKSDYEPLRDKKQKATAEKKNKSKFDDFSKASKDNDYDRAVTSYQDLSDDSVYRDKAQETYAVVRRAYIKDHLAQAEKLRSGSKCDEARKHVEAVLFIDEGNTDAQDIAKKCGQPTPTPKIAKATPSTPRAAKERPETPEARPEARVEAPKPPPEAPKPAAEAPKAPEVSADAEKMVTEAMEDYVHGNYVQASEKAKKATAAGGGPKAWRVYGASACYLKNRDDAVKAWNRLGNVDRQFLKYVCDRNQLKIP